MRSLPLYGVWGYGPNGRAYLVHQDVSQFVASRIDTSDEAHYGDGTWINIGTTWSREIDAILSTPEEVLSAEKHSRRARSEEEAS